VRCGEILQQVTASVGTYHTLLAQTRKTTLALRITSSPVDWQAYSGSTVSALAPTKFYIELLAVLTRAPCNTTFSFSPSDSPRTASRAPFAT